MSFPLTAKYKFKTITGITADFLQQKNIMLLLLDLDNTIAPYAETLPAEPVTKWAEMLRENGVRLYIVSNSHRPERVSAFARALDIPYALRAKKPSPGQLKTAMLETKTEPIHTAIAGDQIFTDTLAGNLAGVTTLLVNPIKLANPLLAARFALETPFRLFSGRGK